MRDRAAPLRQLIVRASLFVVALGLSLPTLLPQASPRTAVGAASAARDPRRDPWGERWEYRVRNDLVPGAPHPTDGVFFDTHPPYQVEQVYSSGPDLDDPSDDLPVPRPTAFMVLVGWSLELSIALAVTMLWWTFGPLTWATRTRSGAVPAVLAGVLVPLPLALIIVAEWWKRRDCRAAIEDLTAAMPMVIEDPLLVVRCSLGLGIVVIAVALRVAAQAQRPDEETAV